MESEVRRPPGVGQTYTWSTPFFDLTFVDIKTKKGNRYQGLDVITVIQPNISGLVLICPVNPYTAIHYTTPTT